MAQTREAGASQRQDGEEEQGGDGDDSIVDVEETPKEAPSCPAQSEGCIVPADDLNRGGSHSSLSCCMGHHRSEAVPKPELALKLRSGLDSWSEPHAFRAGSLRFVGRPHGRHRNRRHRCRWRSCRRSRKQSKKRLILVTAPMGKDRTWIDGASCRIRVVAWIVLSGAEAEEGAPPCFGSRCCKTVSPCAHKPTCIARSFSARRAVVVVVVLVVLVAVVVMVVVAVVAAIAVSVVQAAAEQQ